MSVLIIDQAARAAVQKVVEHARQRNHWYIPDVSKIPPGDDPAYVTRLDSYRCVFSVTQHQGKLYRHLSISVLPTNRFPHPLAAFQIADLFGFTGYEGDDRPGKDWQLALNPDEKGAVIVQETDEGIAQ